MSDVVDDGLVEDLRLRVADLEAERDRLLTEVRDLGDRERELEDRCDGWEDRVVKLEDEKQDLEDRVRDLEGLVEALYQAEARLDHLSDVLRERDAVWASLIYARVAEAVRGIRVAAGLVPGRTR